MGYYCESALAGLVSCPDGLYADEEGLALCKSCPIGKSCLVKSATPVDCAPGYYSLAGESLCNVSSHTL